MKQKKIKSNQMLILKLFENKKKEKKIMMKLSGPRI